MGMEMNTATTTWTLNPFEIAATQAKVDKINDRAARKGLAGRIVMEIAVDMHQGHQALQDVRRMRCRNAGVLLEHQAQQVRPRALFPYHKYRFHKNPLPCSIA